MKIRSAPVVTFAIAIWFVLMMVPYLGANSWEQFQRISSSPTVVYQVSGIIFACSLSILTLRSDFFHIFGKLESHHLWFLFFCFYTATTSIFSVSAVESIAFTIIHIATYFVFVGLWMSSETTERYLAWLGPAVVVFIVLAWMLLGVRLRSLGYIPPNDLAKLAFVAAVFSLLGGKQLAVGVNLFSISVVILTESRSTLLSMLVFYFVYFIILRPGLAKMIAVLVTIATVCAVLLIDQFSGGPLWQLFVDKVLLLDDATRGVGSGFTGRADYWSAGWAAFGERPIFGYGLRTRAPIATADSLTVNAHSGVINMLLDVGLVGAVLLVLALSFAVGAHVRRIVRYGGAQSKRSLIIVSFFASSIVLWIFEPIYINVGSHVSLALLVFLAAPARVAAAQLPRQRLLTRNPLAIVGSMH